jgi:hypothetical protein
VDKTFIISGVHATPRSVEPAQDGQRCYVREVRRFDLPANISSYFTPKPGDIVMDGTYIWNVWKVQTINIDHIPIVAVCPNLESLFSDYADIYEPTSQLDNFNNLKTIFTLTRRTVQCRLQPITAEEIDWLAKRGLTASYKMWLYGNDPIPFRSVIKIAGVNYKIVSVENQDRIDELMFLWLELNP